MLETQDIADATSEARSLQSSSAHVSGAKRIPALDGFRGLAILFVICFHLRFLGGRTCMLDRIVLGLIDQGWIGVELFFVLSGFLITGILLESKGSRHYWRNFYARRTLRIFPLYYGFLFLFLIVLPAIPVFRFLQEQQRAQFPVVPHSQLWYWMYLSNILFAITGEITALGVTWSLAVEEQFYLLWPVVVAQLGRKQLMAACIVLLVASPFLRFGAVLLHSGFPATYVITPLHMDGLVVGAFIAMIDRDPAHIATLFRASLICGSISFGLFVALIVASRVRRHDVQHDLITQVPLYSVLAVAVGSLMLLILLGGWPSRVFATPLLRRLGKYSYSLYIFHRPVSAAIVRLTKLDQRPAILGSHLPALAAHYTICICTLYGLSFLSWHVYEKQFLRMQRFFPSRGQ